MKNEKVKIKIIFVLVFSSYISSQSVTKDRLIHHNKKMVDNEKEIRDPSRILWNGWKSIFLNKNIMWR